MKMKYNKCHSLSNIYYGTLCKYFPFKQIDCLKTIIESKRDDYKIKRLIDKYGDYAIEDDELKFIWGVRSPNDFSGKHCCLYTANDVSIIYNKRIKKYELCVETAYIFKDTEDECDYLCSCLDAFTRYMDENKLNKNEHILLYMNSPCTSISENTIEELYTSFRIFVEGMCSVYGFQRK